MSKFEYLISCKATVINQLHNYDTLKVIFYMEAYFNVIRTGFSAETLHEPKLKTDGHQNDSDRYWKLNENTID